MEKIRLNGIRLVQDIKPGDPDLFALGTDGKTYQKKVSFDQSCQPIKVEWVLFTGGGHCQAPSTQYLHDLENHGGDPRLMAGDAQMTKKYGGPPDERSSR